MIYSIFTCSETHFKVLSSSRGVNCNFEGYTTTVLSPSNIVTNDEVSCEDVEGGLKKVIIVRTPIMSVCLPAFIVGEYDFVEARWREGHTGVYPMCKLKDGQFVLYVSSVCITV